MSKLLPADGLSGIIAWKREAHLMPSSESRGSSSTPSRASGLGCGPAEMIARLQRLLDTPRPVGGYPLEWFVEAFYLGDLTAIAALSIRSSKLGPAT
jgi:hypothetical protein